MFAFLSRGKSRKLAISSRHKKTPLLPAKTQQFIAHRLTDLYGGALLALGITITAALVSYHPLDPSFNNTAGDDAVVISNWMGKTGAYVSDLLLQTLGAASAFICLALLVWGYRVLRRLPLAHIGSKTALLLLSVLAGAIVLARVPSFDSWGHGAYLGGSAGTLIFSALGQYVQGWLGTTAYIFVAATAAVTFVFAYGAALGLSAAEWQQVFSRLRSGIAVALHRLRVALARFRRWHREASTADVASVRPLRPRRMTVAIAQNDDDDADTDDDDDTQDDDDHDSLPAARASLLSGRKPVIAPRAEKTRPAVKDDKQKTRALRSTDDEGHPPPLDFLGDPPAGRLS